MHGRQSPLCIIFPANPCPHASYPCAPLTPGNQASGVLLGMQVPDAEREEFWRAVAALDPEGYQFTEISGKARQVFKMFIQ
jgi:hypothetical protein